MSGVEIPVSAAAWLASMTGLAAMGMIAAVILLRDHLRLERRNLGLRADVERLQGEIRRLTQAGERRPPAPLPLPLPLPLPASGEPTGPGEAAIMSETEPVALHAPAVRVVPQERQEAALASPPGGSAPKRVLLAEDDEVNALLAVKSLEKAGALIDWAKDGAEAVALVEEVLSGQRPGYDLVLMDLRMPRLNGLEATRRIRLLEAEAGRPAPLRIAALTATTMRQDRLDAQAAGMNLFLSKPYNASALIQLLDPAEGDRARAAG